MNSKAVEVPPKVFGRDMIVCYDGSFALMFGPLVCRILKLNFPTRSPWEWRCDYNSGNHATIDECVVNIERVLLEIRAAIPEKL